MDTFNRLKPMSMLLGIVLLIIGVIFLAVPDRVTEFMAIFTGAIITVFGIFRIITVAAFWKTIINRSLLLAVGIIILLAGVFMLFNPDITITIIGAIIGLFAILLAIDRFVTANRLKREMNVLPTVISGLIHLAFGLGMIYSAIVVFSVIIVLIGIYLLIAGIMFILSTLFFHDF